jgi:hypothetical protein
VFTIAFAAFNLLLIGKLLIVITTTRSRRFAVIESSSFGCALDGWLCWIRGRNRCCIWYFSSRDEWSYWKVTKVTITKDIIQIDIENSVAGILAERKKTGIEKYEWKGEKA